MFNRICTIIFSVPVFALSMDQTNAPATALFESYHKKRSVAEALDSGLPAKKRHLCPEVLTQFKAAIDRQDVAGARQILVDNQYQPKKLNLSEAIRLDELPDIIYWLGAQRNANPADDPFSTALHTASAYGNNFLIQLLLQAGADVNGYNANGWTPLHFAVFHGMTRSMILLLDNGADTNACMVNGHTPLYNITRFYSLDYRGLPYQWLQDLVLRFVSHAQYNSHKTKTAIEESINRIDTFSLVVKRVCRCMPLDIRKKICSYLTHDISSFKMFRNLFAFWEQDEIALQELVEQCPFAWFKALCKAKSTPQERQVLIARLAPIITAYRTRNQPELLPPLDGTKLIYPGAHGPKKLVKQCIKDKKLKELILKTVIDTLSE